MSVPLLVALGRDLIATNAVVVASLHFLNLLTFVIIIIITIKSWSLTITNKIEISH